MTASNVDRFRQLYDAHVRAITAYCARRTNHDRVEDAVSETFLIAWRRIVDVPDDGNALLWLYGVVHRVVGHEWRATARRRRLTTRLGSLRRATPGNPEDAAVNDDDVVRVLEAARALNPNDAEILRLVGWERLSHDEIAKVLDLTGNAVNQRLHRARRNLAREYARLQARPEHSTAAQEGGA